MVDGLKIIIGRSNPELGKEIAEYLGVKPTDVIIKEFSDGEIFVKINENIRGMDVFIIQSTHPPAENIMELLLLIDAAKRASAQRVTAVIPYFGYARQDKKDEPRVPISAKLMANLLTTAGADRILTIDLHAAQIQGFFDIPVDHLLSTPVIIETFKDIAKDDLVIVAPDAGGAKRAHEIAKKMGDLSMAIVDKRRPAPNLSYVTYVVGDVKDKNVLIVDDIVDTAGTLTGAAQALKDSGAKKVMAFCTHPVLSGKAKERIESSPIEKLYVANTIPLKWKSKKIVQVSLAKLFGEAIRRIHNEESVSSLFV